MHYFLHVMQNYSKIALHALFEFEFHFNMQIRHTCTHTHTHTPIDVMAKMFVPGTAVSIGVPGTAVSIGATLLMT